jgi:hypothetical protein
MLFLQRLLFAIVMAALLAGLGARTGDTRLGARPCSIIPGLTPGIHAAI